MTKSQPHQSADSSTPPLRALGPELRSAAEDSLAIHVSRPPQTRAAVPLANLANCLSNISHQIAAQPICRQILWFSFFFDGTGNNRDADLASLKHSNIVRLYRAHLADDIAKGRYRFYIPGVGTYFQEVGDPGGTVLGLGIGDMGKERLQWALKQFDAKLKPHQLNANSPTNAIIEINIAAFGFSRGAALARAFINLLLNERCAQLPDETWQLRVGRVKIRVRFLGLFDTVASVGLPMSTNTTSVAGGVRGVEKMIRDRRNDNKDTIPGRLAFALRGNAGADPAPGKWNGHESYGAQMNIPPCVEEVRHFIAAHEVRNSFPLDSISIIRNRALVKPSHFFETVYPGVHSDVGGGYRPGEGGRSSAPTENFGLIPLSHMYDFALKRGVPFVPIATWDKFNIDDFSTSPLLLDRYDHYMKTIRPSQTLGQTFHLHMANNFAWRFMAIRRRARGDTTEKSALTTVHKSYSAEERHHKKEIASLKNDDFKAKAEVDRLRIMRSNLITGGYGNPKVREELRAIEEQRQVAARVKSESQDRLLREQARLDTLPAMGDFYSMLSFYDKQLLDDAEEIRKSVVRNEGGNGAGELERRENLRPHYRIFLEAYENEYYKKNRGLRDEKIIAFFDNHLHDSLPGFAKDATLPSDPRVVYLGGDEKYRYAAIDDGSPHSAKPTFTA